MTDYCHKPKIEMSFDGKKNSETRRIHTSGNVISVAKHKSRFSFLKNYKKNKTYTFLASYLKKIPAFYYSVKFIKTKFFLMVKFAVDYLSKEERRQSCKINKYSDYLLSCNIEKEFFANTVEIEPPRPNIFPSTDSLYFSAPSEGYSFPEISVALINNALVYGGTNIVRVNSDVICHDLYDFDKDYTSEELHNRLIVNPANNKVRWIVKDKAPEHFPLAATFVDACAENYAHWITEVLPRIALFCSSEKFKEVPIVVNSDMHGNIMDSLYLVAGKERDIILAPAGRALLIDRLYLTSVVGYVPFDKRTTNSSDNSHGLFNPAAMSYLREFFGELCTDSLGGPFPEKIYLRRNSGLRNVVNIAEIEKKLIDEGFVMVEPEKLSFLQQVALFKHAKVVISSTGAALSNAVFCRPGTRVAVIMGKHKDMIYKYWANLLSPLGISVYYLLGDIVKNRHLGIHGDLLVSPVDFKDLLEALEKK